MKYFIPLILISLVIFCGCTVGRGNGGGGGGGVFPPNADISAEPPLGTNDDGRDYRILVANGLGETLTQIARTDGIWNTTQAVMETGQSPNQLVYHNDLCYLVNSLSNSIQIFDPVTFETIREISTGASTNPMYLDFVDSNTVIVTCHLSNDVLLVDISDTVDDERILERIAMPSGDNLPNDDDEITYARPGGVVVIGDTAYVACANLNVFSVAGGPGLIIEINLETFEIVETYKLTGRNTTQIFYSTRFPERLIALSAGDYVAVDGYVGNGCIESIDLTSGEIFQVIPIDGAPGSCVVGEDDILHCENAKDGTVLRVDLHSGNILDGYELPDYGERFSYASAILSLPGLLLVTNFNSDRLHILDPSTGEITAELTTGDGPDAIALVD